MTEESKQPHAGEPRRSLPPLAAPDRAEIERHPELVMELLEPDQVVVAKRRTRFGRRRLGGGERALLWVLRVYVIAMQLLVLFTVLRAFRAAH
ncbi:MAG TPA: hypothetical protein VGS20_07800 [Candidatus Acidoferrales bacterium]|nr:hypothetical protein [Candidatus Acidoferrales bacterium]